MALQARRRLLISWIFLGIGFLLGLYCCVEQWRVAADGKLLLIPFLFAYSMWCLYWGLLLYFPAHFRFCKKLGAHLRFPYNIVVLVFTLLIGVWIGHFIGLLGGGIYQHIRYYNLASR